jgi:hypothetical protein
MRITARRYSPTSKIVAAPRITFADAKGFPGEF